jgi:hypothetical protein
VFLVSCAGICVRVWVAQRATESAALAVPDTQVTMDALQRIALAARA